MRLASILDPASIVLDVGAGTKREVLARLAAPIAQRRPDLVEAELLDELDRRERESSTAIADGIAIPHARTNGDDGVVAAFGLSANGVDFDSLDGQPTRLLMVLASPATRPELHIQWLAHVAGVLGDAPTRRLLLQATSPAAVLAALEDRERELDGETSTAESAP